MCNMMMVQHALPSFVEDPASERASTKPVSLPMLNVALRRQLTATISGPERYSRRADGVSFQSEAFRLRTQAKISELVRTATAASTDDCSTNALLAKKALKYRRVLERRPLATATAVQC
ncbi:hypothetical protein PHYSODRAFT_308701 [Phytophthora sojae]|uniref:Uncharacterized protein n=1 Tax=Phytophthora sojae (strain P6497) TaxID=1094619 RepID=G4YGV2_PHYSP|nr:hypothetical protein PHYSODRAFT_308701 [Phytophthora sojae]EGZ27433.1 hypothetical protein PHYSODRAFT_308701 [Phytophthora sojae]|eukprot:XP_009514708.1 hypothetical protein PHYSODRAFT_308701 [Phytophthora sojae]